MCQKPVHRSRFRAFSLSMAACLVLVVLAMLPFAGALEIHHVFADMDHDGHDHSDFDLCQWVQQHTSGSLLLDAPVLAILNSIDFDHAVYVNKLWCAEIEPGRSSRATGRRATT